ncbi:hypothetical protein HBA54_10225 [Pelagibius litoralis]|uniref:Uncharacterized protein n=1 Tax=Pelagibius litoralis TaxID=374515 RepID=A0A967CCE3_9PROT|nr:hypothetical protein [Pelagibius litoralis]NIA68969.1 hypothetical protein [Pelagibius litoralis]
MSTIVFHGRVIPERADFNATGSGGNPIQRSIETPFGEIGCHFTILKSVISVRCITNNVEINLETLRNLVVNSLVSVFTDAHGIASGIGYDVEIVSALNVDSGYLRVFGADERIDTTDPFPELAQLVQLAGSDLQLRSAMANFRRSIRMPIETAFYCYRAIEAVKGFFLSMTSGRKDIAAWREMRTALNLQQSTLAEFKVAADQMRHGIIVDQTWGQRKRQMEIAREVVRRFAHFLANDKTRLSSEKFPEY